MSDIADRHEHNPDPNNAGCCLTGMEEPGVSFRGQSPADMFQHILFIGETALHEAVAAFYGITVDEAHKRLNEDARSNAAKLKAAQKEIAQKDKDLAKWVEFKSKAAEAGLLIDL